MEIWKNFADGYQVSSLGNIKSLRRKTPKILKPFKYGGYPHVALHIDGQHKRFAVHRLVAQAFIPNPDNKPQVNHINGVKHDNRVDNLEWCTQLENSQHARDTGLITQGGDDSQSKLTNEQAAWIRKVYIPRDVNFGAKALAKKFSVSRAVVIRIIHGTGYKTAGGVIHPKFRVPDDIRSKICRLYKRGVVGYGSKSLAKQFNVSKTTVQRILKENQITPRPARAQG